MNILVNASNLTKGGGIQVGDAFIRELRDHPEHRYLVVCSREVANSLGDLKDFPDFIRIEVAPAPGMVQRIRRRNALLERLTREFAADAVFTVFGPSYWRPPVPHLCGFAYGCHLYYDSPFYRLIPWWSFLRFKVRRMVLFPMFRRDSDVFCVESADAAQRMRRSFPGKRIEVVSNTYNPVFDAPTEWREFKLPEFSGTTMLTVSAAYPHKNLSIIKPTAKYLLHKYPDFKFRFVVTLPPDFFGFGAGNCPDWLLAIGKVDIRECPSLYKQSDIMFLPTLMDIFSANYPEAMRMKVPVATSALGFARGLCGDAAEYFDPLSPESIGETIYRLANDPGRRAELVASGKKRLGSFKNSSERAAAYLRILEDIAAKKGGAR